MVKPQSPKLVSRSALAGR